MKNESDENLIYGRHPVLEALNAGKPIDRIFIKKGVQEGFFDKVRKMAAKEGILFTPVDEAALDRVCDGKRHQGIAARLSLREYDTIDDIFQVARNLGEDPFILVLNEVQDPQNLGSLIRSAAGAGVHGVIISKHRSARLSPAVSKAAAGADAYVKVALVTNISDTLEALKERGLFVLGADSTGEKTCFEMKVSGPLALVLGGEDKGLGQRVRTSCDELVKIPLKNQIFSLNVGVAGAILMFFVRNHM